MYFLVGSVKEQRAGVVSVFFPVRKADTPPPKNTGP